MRKHYDVAVVGLGIMGSAIAYHLARAGKSVIGLERFWPDHALGSSSGHTRLFRVAHFEHPDYVTLARRSRELWAEAAQATGLRLMLDSGVLTVGAEDSAMVRGTITSAARADVGHRVLAKNELGRAFPAMRFAPDDVGLFEEDAGILLVERCVAAHRELAVRAGAELRFGAPLLRRLELPRDATSAVSLALPGGTVEASTVVLSAGPWTSALLPEGLAAPALSVERILSYWLEPDSSPAEFEPARLPVLLWDHPLAAFCVFPRVGEEGVKIAFHHNGSSIEPDAIRRTPSDDELTAMRAHLAAAIPALNGRVRDARACMYTNTRDGHFAIGPLADPRVVLVAACSGNGFKFGPVVGEIVADLVSRGARPSRGEVYSLDRPTL
jgi:sarcosine oxidase